MASRSGRSSSGRSSSKLLSYLSSNTSSAPPPSSSSKPRRSKASSSSSSGSVKESSPREPPRSSLPPLREYREYRESRRPKETRETRPSRDTREKESREPREITPSTVFLSLIAFRLINALLVRTFFQPDEFFQSLEPAWQLAFGKDQGAWMTWVGLLLYYRLMLLLTTTGMEKSTAILLASPPVRCRLSRRRPPCLRPPSLPHATCEPPNRRSEDRAGRYRSRRRLLHLEICSSDPW